MSKFIMFVVIMAIVWAIPPARAQVGAAALPALELLGPRGEAVIRPARREAAKKQLRSVGRVLSTDLETGRELPVGDRAFQQWMKQRIPELSGNDPWHKPYWLETRSGQLVIGSSGPDGLRGTDDDIRHSPR
jgi:hypothetical protein